MAKKKSSDNKEKLTWADESQVGVDELTDENDFVTTGSILFDYFLGGGFTSGLYRFGGAPEKGKTAQALTWAANWLKHYKNGQVIYFDAESRLSKFKFQVSPLSQIDNINERFVLYKHNIYEDIAQYMYDSIADNPDGKRYFFVVDSLNAMISRRDLGYSFDEDEQVASIAKLSTRLMQRSGPLLRREGHHLHVLSQVRAKINTGGYGGGGNKSDAGGFALQHNTDLWGDIENPWSEDFIWEFPEKTKKEDKGRIFGHYFKVNFAKTPNDKSGQKIRVPIKRAVDGKSSGVWKVKEVVDFYMMMNVLQLKGSWYSFTEEFIESTQGILQMDQTKWQGGNNMMEYFEDNPELVNQLENHIRDMLF